MASKTVYCKAQFTFDEAGRCPSSMKNQHWQMLDISYHPHKPRKWKECTVASTPRWGRGEGVERRTREDGLSAPFSVSFRKYLTFLVLIRKTTLVGGMGREMGGRFGRDRVDMGLPMADSC